MLKFFFLQINAQIDGKNITFRKWNRKKSEFCVVIMRIFLYKCNEKKVQNVPNDRYTEQTVPFTRAGGSRRNA